MKDPSIIEGSNHIEKQTNELLERNKLLLATIDHSRVGVLITDPNKEDNPIIYVNKGFENMTGYTVEETLGRNCRFLQGENTNPDTVKELRVAIQNNQEVHTILLNYRKDKTKFWNELTINPVKTESGKVSYMIGVQNDVTTRVELEMELEYDLKLSQLLQQMQLSDPYSDEYLEISGFHLPSGKVGGDFYKWQKLNNGLYSVFVMDVMGHGITSALLTMSINAILLSLTQREVYNPSEVLHKLNQHMFDLFPGDSIMTKYYFTCIYLLVDTKEKKIEYVNAGHPSFVVKSINGVEKYSSTTVPVGFLKDHEFKPATFYYQDEIELTMFTDGLYEHLKLELEKLCDTFQNRNRFEQLIESLKESKPEDDICLVRIHFRNEKKKNTAT